MNDILDAERNVMFWEKKIQIAKETELALDPMVGKEEINRMKREIYIMEQRLHNLKKEQKRKVEDMEKQVDHRDVLRTKGQAVQASTGSGQRQKTKATLQKENQRLVSELKAKKGEAQKRDQQIKDCLANTEKTALEIEQVVAEISDLQGKIENMQVQANRKVFTLPTLLLASHLNISVFSVFFLLQSVPSYSPHKPCTEPRTRQGGR